MSAKRREAQLISKAKCAYRSRLSVESQEVYDKLAKAIAQRKRSLTIPSARTEDVQEAFYAIRRDQPFLFDLKRDLLLRQNGAYTTIEWEFQLSDAEAEEHERRIYRELRRIKGMLPQETKVLRSERNIHNLMQRLGIKANYDETTKWYNHCIVGPLLYHETVCEGAALLFYLLCLLEGVPCQVITGIGSRAHETGRHAWNLVKLGTQYAHVDAFWDMCSYSGTQGHCYDYFNLQDQQIRIDHSWDAERYPVCVAERYSWFALNRADVSTAEEFRALLERCFAEKKTTVRARFRRTLLPEAEIVRVAQQVFFAGGRVGSINYHTNEEQRIVQIAVEYS